jgi:hypothetical protein
VQHALQAGERAENGDAPTDLDPLN